MSTTFPHAPAPSDSQRGIGTTSLLWNLLILILLVFAISKIGPVYWENVSAVHIVRDVISDPEIRKQSPRDIERILFSRFDASYLSGIRSKEVSVGYARDGAPYIRLHYVRKVPLWKNAYFLFEYDKKFGVMSRSESSIL